MKKLSTFLLFAIIYSSALAQVGDNTNMVNVPPDNQPCCSAPKLAFTIPNSNAIVFNSNNTLTLSQPITITANGGKKITEIKAELSYFEFMPGSEDCLTCNKNSATFGNFLKGTFSSTTAVGAGTHELASNFSAPKPSGSFPASLTITLPPLVKCCEGIVRWCVRYIVSLDDCTVCTKVVCYEKKKTANTTTENSQTTKSN